MDWDMFEEREEFYFLYQDNTNPMLRKPDDQVDIEWNETLVWITMLPEKGDYK